MAVLVGLLLVGWMRVIVCTMIPGVIVVVNQRVSMVVPMFVFVEMLVAVSVGVLVRVFHVAVNVFVSVRVAVIVDVQMLVLVVAVHDWLLSVGVTVQSLSLHKEPKAPLEYCQ